MFEGLFQLELNGVIQCNKRALPWQSSNIMAKYLNTSKLKCIPSTSQIDGFISFDLPLNHTTSCPHQVRKYNIFQLVVNENKIKKKSNWENLVICGACIIIHSLCTI
jgi:hypothetical protein